MAAYALCARPGLYSEQPSQPAIGNQDDWDDWTAWGAPAPLSCAQPEPPSGQEPLGPQSAAKMLAPKAPNAPAASAQKSIPPHLRNYSRSPTANAAASNNWRERTPTSGNSSGGAAVSLPPHLRNHIHGALPSTNAAPNPALLDTIKDSGAHQSRGSSPHPSSHSSKRPPVNSSTVAHAKALLSPPSSPLPEDQTSAMPNHGSSWEYRGRGRGRGNGRGRGRGRGRGGPSMATERKPWPKARDMKAQSVHSDDNVTIISFSDGDMNYDVKKLIAWNGDWLPPPVDWDSRKSFTDRHFAEHVEAWVAQMDKSYGNVFGKNIDYGGIDITSKRFKAAYAGDVNAEVALPSWIPRRIDGDAPQSFWRTYPARAPAPQSDTDLADRQPWWESFPDTKVPFLAPCQVPDAHLDPADPENDSPGVFATVQDVLARRAYAREEQRRRTVERRTRPVAYNTLPPPPEDKIKGPGKVYLRPVIPADVEQIRDLYNHYVRNTIKAIEFNDQTTDQIRRRIDEITSLTLPFIVAVRGGKPGSSDRYKQGYVSEEVVGFINIDDYSSRGSMWRYSFEMELYVHPEWLRRGVGSCLVDKLLDMVDPKHTSHYGYEWKCVTNYLSHGSNRVISNISFTVPHVNGHKEEMDWMPAWLDKYGFRKAGHVRKAGVKYGNFVDYYIFQHLTGESINPHVRPSEPI